MGRPHAVLSIMFGAALPVWSEAEIEHKMALHMVRKPISCAIADYERDRKVTSAWEKIFSIQLW